METSKVKFYLSHAKNGPMQVNHFEQNIFVSVEYAVI